MLAKRLFPAAVLLVILLGMSPAAAGPNDKYSVVTLVNETPYRVYYTYRWGGDGSDSWNGSVAPNSSYNHWWTFSYQGEDYAPWFHVQLDGESGWYKMGSFFSPDKSDGRGRIYYIRFDRPTEQFKVYAKLYTD